MMYRVAHEKNINDLAVIGIKNSVLTLPDIFITNGTQLILQQISIALEKALQHSLKPGILLIASGGIPQMAPKEKSWQNA